MMIPMIAITNRLIEIMPAAIAPSLSSALATGTAKITECT